MTIRDIRAATVPQNNPGPGSSLPSTWPYATGGSPGGVTRAASVEASRGVGGHAQPRPKNRPDSAPPSSTTAAATATAPSSPSAVASPGLSRASSVGVSYAGVSCAGLMAFASVPLSVVAGGSADGNDQAGPGRDGCDLNGSAGLWCVNQVGH